MTNVGGEKLRQNREINIGCRKTDCGDYSDVVVM